MTTVADQVFRYANIDGDWTLQVSWEGRKIFWEDRSWYEAGVMFATENSINYLVVDEEESTELARTFLLAMQEFGGDPTTAPAIAPPPGLRQQKHHCGCANDTFVWPGAAVNVYYHMDQYDDEVKATIELEGIAVFDMEPSEAIRLAAQLVAIFTAAAQWCRDMTASDAAPHREGRSRP